MLDNAKINTYPIATPTENVDDDDKTKLSEQRRDTETKLKKKLRTDAGTNLPEATRPGTSILAIPWSKNWKECITRGYANNTEPNLSLVFVRLFLPFVLLFDLLRLEHAKSRTKNGRTNKEDSPTMVAHAPFQGAFASTQCVKYRSCSNNDDTHTHANKTQNDSRPVPHNKSITTISMAIPTTATTTITATIAALPMMP